MDRHMRRNRRAWRLALFAAGAFLLLLLPLALLSSARKKPPAKALDLNSATLEQLQQLPGIGPVTARQIVDFRKKSGPFRRVEDLLAIRGISKKRLDQLRPYIFVRPLGRTKAP